MRRLGGLVLAVALLAACGDDGPAKFAELYDTAPPAAVPARTDPVPADGAVPDGTYWARGVSAIAGSDTATIIGFTVVQAFFGPACLDEFGSDLQCPNDVGVKEEPAREIQGEAASLRTVTVVDAGTQVNYAVDGEELGRLLSGEPPNTPEGVDFTFTSGFPFLVTVRDGAVISAFQIWQP